MSSSQISAHVPLAVPRKDVGSSQPFSWAPYFELMRLSNPVGTLLTFFPHLFGSLYAAYASQPPIALHTVVVTNLVFLPAACILHSAGCSWNDIIDADLDRQVARTRSRPMARGAISPRNGYIFTVAEFLVWLAILSQLSVQCVLWGLPLVFLVVLYPYAKRITHYPQVVLGFTLSWGTLIGCVSMGVNPISVVMERSSSVSWALICIISSYIVWTTIIDMIYAHQDLQDDIKAGILSMAVRYKEYPKPTLWVLAGTQVGLLVSTGLLMGFGPVYMTGTCVGSASLLICMIWEVDLKDSSQCWWWFQYGSMIMGTIIAMGMFGEYLGTR